MEDGKVFEYEYHKYIWEIYALNEVFFSMLCKLTFLPLEFELGVRFAFKNIEYRVYVSCSRNSPVIIWPRLDLD